MKIEVEVLGWTDICCGCRKKIPSTEKVYMISGIAGVNGSIHLCETCIDDISGSKGPIAKEGINGEFMKNINCYICKTKMDYIKNSELTILGGECEEYRCSKCGEVIYHPIQNQGRKSVIMDRKSILERIEVGSQWTFPDNKKNYQAIIENMNFLWDILNLGDIINDLINIELENKKQGTTEPQQEITGWLTARQVKCRELISDNLSKRNVQGAFHELYDFIESYKRLYDKPIDIIERIIISSSITQIRRTLEEKF